MSSMPDEHDASAPPPLRSALGDRATFLKRSVGFADVGLTLQPSAEGVWMVLEQKNGERRKARVCDVQAANAERYEFVITTSEGKHTLRCSSRAQLERWLSYVPEVRAARQRQHVE